MASLALSKIWADLPNVTRKNRTAGWKPRRGSFSFSSLTAFRSLGAASQHGGATFGLGPERPGPQGGASPPLASFAGLRSRSLISFFVFFVLSLIYVPSFVSVCLSSGQFRSSLMYSVKFLNRLRGKFGNFYRRKLRRLSRAGEGSESGFAVRSGLSCFYYRLLERIRRSQWPVF